MRTTYDLFKVHKERKDAGHDTGAEDDMRGRRIGFRDLTTGELFSVSLSQVQNEFTPSSFYREMQQPDGSISTSSSGFFMAFSPECLSIAEEAESRDWQSLGLTWKLAKKTIRTAKSRATWFGSPTS